MTSARRILVTGARAPVAVEAARLFALAGHEVHVADSTPILLAAGSRACTRAHQLPGARHEPRAYGKAVSDLVSRYAIDVVFPTCEEVFFLAAGRDRGGWAIPVFAPSLEILRRLHHKGDFIELARHAGLPVPHTRILTCAADVEAMRAGSRRLVFKPAYSRFGVETLLGPAPEALDRIRPTGAAPWVAQERLEGEELSAYAVASSGRLTAFAAYRPRYRMGRAAGYYFDPIDCPQSEAVAAAVAVAVGLDGQIAFDLIRDADGRVLPIECNPRATSGLHLFAGSADFADAVLGLEGSHKPAGASFSWREKVAAERPDEGFGSFREEIDSRAGALCVAPARERASHPPPAAAPSPHGRRTHVTLRPPQTTQPRMVALAMLLFGLPPALLGNLSGWRRDFSRAADVLSCDGDRLNGRALRVFASYAVQALRRRVSLRAVATRDIEWDGEVIDA